MGGMIAQFRLHTSLFLIPLRVEPPPPPSTSLSSSKKAAEYTGKAGREWRVWFVRISKLRQRPKRVQKEAASYKPECIEC